MKTCPTCHRTYEDDTIVYCLDDGARLDDGKDQNATLNLPGPTVYAAARQPSPTAPNQATITAKPEHYQGPYAPTAATSASSSRKSSWPWIFAIVLVIGISGVLVAWLLSRGGDNQAQIGKETPTPMITPPPASPASSIEAKASPKREATPFEDGDRSTPKPTPAPTREQAKGFAVLNNMTFNGSRITYYPRPSFAQCQADCAGNANCRGFTWIRPGAYNPGDSAMCYLMSAVTARVPHACCISGVRN